MSTKEHKEKAEHDEFFVTSTDNPFFDWQVVGQFYAALHYIQAYFVKVGYNPPPATHNMRDSYVSRDSRLRNVYDDYRELENESRTARYDPRPGQFKQTDVQRLQKNLETIKNLVIPLL